MSSCWTNCGWQNETRPETGPMYYSERGEVCPPHLDSNLTEYLEDGEQYAYLYTKYNTWKCWDRNEFNDKQPELVPIPMSDS